MCVCVCFGGKRVRVQAGQMVGRCHQQKGMSMAVHVSWWVLHACNAWFVPAGQTTQPCMARLVGVTYLT